MNNLVKSNSNFLFQEDLETFLSEQENFLIEKRKEGLLDFQMKDLIEGWKEGMMYLKPGGKIKLIVPPYLGYGDYKLEKIPPHSILYFEIEVIDVK
jgi:FKBP-type peptidyl-prolyl cis-trans isomerase